MIKEVLNKWWKAEGQDQIETPVDEKAQFVLFYKKLPIGKLSLFNGVWSFEYTEEFKAQNQILPLIDFPNLELVYQSNQLWPFFSYRIPGLNQPSVMEIIQKRNIDKHNEVELLKQFGQLSIYNPYRLSFSI